MPSNKVLNLDMSWVNSINLSESDVLSQAAAAKFTNKQDIVEHSRRPWLLMAIKCVDLAALVGTETPEEVEKLCKQATFPLQGVEGFDATLVGDCKVQCATVCLYPLRVEDATKSLASLGVEKEILVAAVAGGFPSGQFPLHTRLAEIYYAVASGAREIDVVIDRSLVLRGLWDHLYEELVQMRKACGDIKLKVILSVTECGSWTNVYKASVVAMSAGADFIKTSTGKEAATATILQGFVMCLAIRDFYKRTGVKVGLKPAGGIRSVEHAVSWMLMVKEVLGEEWLHPNLFRIGTSGSSSMIPDVANTLVK